MSRPGAPTGDAGPDFPGYHLMGYAVQVAL